MTKITGGQKPKRKTFYSTIEAFIARTRQDPETTLQMHQGLRELANDVRKRTSMSRMQAFALIRTAVEIEIVEEIARVHYRVKKSAGREGIASVHRNAEKPATWEDIGAELGLSASGANRKYEEVCRRQFGLRLGSGPPKK